MTDRPMTYMEREEQLGSISEALGKLVGELEDRGDAYPDELTQIASALDHAVRHDPGHNELGPLDKDRPILLPVPAIFTRNNPPVVAMPMLSVDDPNAAPEAPRSVRQVGSVTTTVGSGHHDYIMLQWKHVTGMIYGRDLLRAWLSTFSPAEAGHIPWSPASQDVPQ